MRTSELQAELFAALLAHNEEKEDARTLPSWLRCYRLMVVSALNRIPREKLPEDLAAVGIIVQASELLPWSLLVACGNQGTKAFAGDGIIALLQWLDRCHELFCHVSEVSADLPVGRSGEIFGRACGHTAGEIRYLTGQLREALEQFQIAKEDDDDDEEPEHSSSAITPLFVPGENFAHIASHLYELIREWIELAESEAFMESVAVDNRTLAHCRTLADMPNIPAES